MPGDGTTDIEKIKDAIEAMGKKKILAGKVTVVGGQATGVQITQWLMDKYNVDPAVKKTLTYRINALLAAKQSIFQKVKIFRMRKKFCPLKKCFHLGGKKNCDKFTLKKNVSA